MITVRSRPLTTRVRCEKDRLEGVKRVNASRVQNVMVAFTAIKQAFEKELNLRQNMKEEVLKIVKSDVDSLKTSVGDSTKKQADNVIESVEVENQ